MSIAACVMSSRRKECTNAMQGSSSTAPAEQAKTLVLGVTPVCLTIAMVLQTILVYICLEVLRVLTMTASPVLHANEEDRHTDHKAAPGFASNAVPGSASNGLCGKRKHKFLIVAMLAIVHTCQRLAQMPINMLTTNVLHQELIH